MNVIAQHRYFLILIILHVLACNKDVLDVRVEGIVHNGKQPISHFTLYFTNYYYEGGDHDGFMPAEYYSCTTDTNGYYTILFPRSAYFQVDTVSTGYSPLLQEKYVYSCRISLNFNIGAEE